MEGTPGAVLWMLLRGGIDRAALRGWIRLGGFILTESFRNGAHTAGPVCHFDLPEEVDHGFVTWGVLVIQVGVNLLRRAVVVTGVDAVKQAK